MIQAGIFTQLKNDPTLAGLLADGSGGYNIYPHRLPEDILGSFNYFITYLRISETIDMKCDFHIASFQINAIAKTYNNVQSLADNIVRVLNDFTGNMGGIQLVDRSWQVNQIDTYDDDAKMFFVPIDFKFVFKN